MKHKAFKNMVSQLMTAQPIEKKPDRRKLTEKSKAKMYKLLDAGMTQDKVAKKLGVSSTTVNRYSKLRTNN